MSARAWFAVAVALFVLGCAEHDPWPGRYEGTSVTRGRDCTTGAPFPDEASDSAAIELERLDDGRLVTGGACSLTLTQLTDATALYDPLVCDTVSPSGTPTRLRVINGRAELDGDELFAEIALELSTPTSCVSVSHTVIAFRSSE